METTKSIVVKKFGSYDAISVENFKLPPLEGNIEVEVKYGGLNFADLYTRQGLMYDKRLPFILGMECTGVIRKVGIDNSEFKEGQHVICYDVNGGMYRQTIRVSPDKCYQLPDHIGLEQGAAIFVNYLTAYLSIFDLGNLKDNETVLIQSCAGGVGWAATQLAKTVPGVTIIGTASTGKETEAQSNGVDQVVSPMNFQTEIKSLYPEGFDLIISNQTGPTFNLLQTLLKPLGRIVLLGANNIIQNDKKLSMYSLMKMWLTTKNITLESLIVNNRIVAGLHLGTLIDQNPKRIHQILAKIYKLIEDHQIEPRIHQILTMEQIIDATKLLAERKNIGKVLIKIND